METPLALPIEAPDDRADKFRWFAAGSCVIEEAGECRAFVWGTLIGRYRIADRDLGLRNAVLLALAQDRRTHRGRLGQAFGMTDEQIRRLVKQADEEGLARVVTSKRGGSEGKTPLAVQKKLRRAFDEGMKAREAYERIGCRHGLSLSTVKRQRWAWEDEKEQAATTARSDRQAASGAAAPPPTAEALDAAVAESLPLFATPLVPAASATEADGPDVETPVDA